MRKELQEIEIIENYLMGKMNASEKADFEKQLETDANLAGNVELQKSLMAGLERMGLKNDLQIAKRNLFIRKVWTWFGVVLMLSTIGFLGYTNLEKDTVRREEVIQNRDEGLKMKEDSLVTQNDTTNFVTLSDTTNLVTLSDSRSGQNKNSLVTHSDSQSGQDFESAEIPVKQFQTFKIDPTKPNTITGAEGTIIDFPANAFDTKSKEIVEIKLQEFYKLSDMVFANLTTQTADGELIETGGMVNIEAYQGDGKLNLSEGKSIDLKFPYENKKEGMQTFLGKKDERGNVVWEEEVLHEGMVIPQEQDQGSRSLTRPSLNFETVEIFTIVEDMPIFPGCEELVSRKLKENCTSEKIVEYLSKNAKYPSYDSKITGKNKVFVTFTINERGLVQSAKVIRSSTPELNKYAIAAVKSLPRLNPGKQRGIPVKVQYTIPLTYDVSENSTNGLNERELQQYMTEINKRVKEVNDKELEDVLLDSAINEENRLNMVQGYVLSSSNLGWINCDSYPLAVNGKSSFNVFEKDETINCSLILHSVRGIVRPTYIKQGKYIFTQLPNEEEVSVLAFKMENNKNYVSYYKTVHNKQDHQFEFEPLTKEKLNQITAELDAIKN